MEKKYFCDASHDPLDKNSQNMCRQCVNQQGRDYRKEHPEQVMSNQLKHLYGITLKEYNDLFALQNGLCAGCLQHQTAFSRRLAVDHDHKLNKVRGLLCNACNRGIGYLKDSPAILRRMADYLEKGGK